MTCNCPSTTDLTPAGERVTYILHTQDCPVGIEAIEKVRAL